MQLLVRGLHPLEKVLTRLGWSRVICSTDQQQEGDRKMCCLSVHALNSRTYLREPARCYFGVAQGVFARDLVEMRIMLNKVPALVRSTLHIEGETWCQPREDLSEQPQASG